MKDFFAADIMDWILAILAFAATLLTVILTPIEVGKLYKAADEKSLLEIKKVTERSNQIEKIRGVAQNDIIHMITVQRKGTIDEIYEKRNIDKVLKKTTFVLAVVISIIGTVILFLGVILNLFFDKEITWITVSAGAIVECIAGLFFWLVNKTMKEVNLNTRKLERNEEFTTAVSLVEKIEDSATRDSVYSDIIKQLISDNMK